MSYTDPQVAQVRWKSSPRFAEYERRAECHAGQPEAGEHDQRGPGRVGNRPRLTPATIAHRLGTLRMFFLHIEERGWDEAPPKVPMFPAAACRQADRRMLVRVTVEVSPRTGLRVSEFTGLRGRCHGAHRRRVLAARPRPASSAKTATCRCTPSSSPSSTRVSWVGGCPAPVGEGPGRALVAGRSSRKRWAAARRSSQAFAVRSR